MYLSNIGGNATTGNAGGGGKNSGSVGFVASSPSSNGAVEKNKQWQRELLMERIRSHASQQKSFPELCKSMRMSMLEKRYALDTVEKSNLQKCLDSMQHCIKVTSRQGLVERLESLSRQLGLKFMEDTAGLFISTDMFYLEIMLDASGALTDVKVHHECKIEQQSCSELVNCLNRGDFADFTVQLEGLSSIYQLNAEPKVKKKAFVALQAMETDLYNLYQGQNFSKDTQQLLESSTVGLVLKRRGGHPMRLTYFVAPNDLISIKDKCLQPLSLDLISNRDIGMSVTVNLEASSANKLQVLPTVTFIKDSNTGVDTPAYAPLTQLNSTLLPATFVLRLNKPLPVCSATLRALFPSATGVDKSMSTGTSALDQKSGTTLSSRETSATIMNLVVQTSSKQQLNNSAKGLFVCLPDQTHCYFFTDNKQLMATLVSSIPFTEPAQVPIILGFLKKQALFYSLLSSCVRPQSKMGNDMDTTTILEVNAISFQQISVSLQHSFEESMATVDFNLNESSVSCSMYAANRNYDLLSIKLTTIVQKSLSIPITLRALLKFWAQEHMNMFQPNMAGGLNTGTAGGGGNVGNNNAGAQANSSYGNFSLAMGPNDPGGGGGGGGGGGTGASGGNVNVVTKHDTNNAVVQATQRPFAANTSNSVANVTAAAGISGYLKFKTEHIKQEDFHESPKSTTQIPTITQMQSVEAGSLGQIINAQQPQTADIATTIADLEIADKYKNIWKDKTANLKNSVSITPILHGIPAAPVATCESSPVLCVSNMEIKRSGIEIIPLLTQSANALIHNSNSNGSNTTTNASTASSSSTITITAIGSSMQQHQTPKNDKKSNTVSTASSSTISSSTSMTSKRNLSETTSSAGAEQKEKKRSKKKRDDSPMGPPEKIFSRQNSPATISNACPDTVTRKFSSPSSSPKGSSGGLLASAAAGNASSTISSRPSPKHSPVYTSPKHQSTASNSPKSPFGTHSPKHGSSGKPSMSTLKSAAASLSPKTDKVNSSFVPVGVCSSSASGAGGVCLGGGGVGSTGGIVSSASSSSTGVLGRPIVGMSGAVSTASINNSFVTAATATVTAATLSKCREKDKIATCVGGPASANTVSSSSTSLQPMKASSSNINNLSISAGGLGVGGGAFNAIGVGVVGGGAGGGIGPLIASGNTLDAVMRKSTASSAVSLMTSTTVSSVTAATVAVAAATTPAHGNTKQQISDEYRVKQSQEGLKLTINKTRKKLSSSLTSKVKLTNSDFSDTEDILNVLNNLPTKKQHTGLKPGVNSGPASTKKSTLVLPPTSHITKHLFQKSHSSGNLLTNMSSHNSPVPTTGHINSNTIDHPNLNRKLNNQNLERERGSILSSSSSQPATRLDHHADMMKILQYASPTMAANLEGFMKNLSTKFQIPKLSQKAALVTTATTTVESSAVITKLNASATPTNTPTSLSTMPFNATKVEKQAILQQQQQQQQHYENHPCQQQLRQMPSLIKIIRPPPPPYHAAIAASITAAAESTDTRTAEHTKPSIETVDQKVQAKTGDDIILANVQVSGE